MYTQNSITINKKTLILLSSLFLILTGGLITYATPPVSPYTVGETLDPICNPGDPFCFVDIPTGWGLTGNTGTDGGLTNFIGTTDAQDFVVKTNGNQIALFGQHGNVALGSALAIYTAPVASGAGSLAFGPQSQATGLVSVALGLFSQATGTASIAIGSGSGPNVASATASVTIGNRNTVNGNSSFAVGTDNTIDVLSSSSFIFGRFNSTSITQDTQNSYVIGRDNMIKGQDSYVLGRDLTSESYWETVIGSNNTDYVPQSNSSWMSGDRLFTIGNGDFKAGNPLGHNAYTLWKDGSFAYNDDNFQNDTLGTEQNMFYFNYGNHDGLGVAQTKRAIRLGSTINDEWDIDSANVGDRSIAIGFGSTSAIGDGSLSLQNGYAQGSYSFAVGLSKGSNAQGDDSIALGYDAFASGNESIALGNSQATGLGAYSFGYGRAYGDKSLSLGLDGSSIAYSGFETVMGYGSTLYIPVDTNNINGLDRLFVVGNGTGPGTESDALTILKDGRTAVAVDNFETNALPLATSVFQVGDGTTGIIGYVDSGTGNWVAVSDERKKNNIVDISYGLSDILKLRPVSFNYNRNNEHTIGFLAQQVLPIIPESVYGTEQDGYGMSYQTLVPVTVKAIQELNLQLTSIEDLTKPNTFRESLVAWLGDTANGITDFVAGRVRTNELCVGNTCLNESQIQQILQSTNTQVSTPVHTNIPDNTTTNDTGSNTEQDQTIVPVDTGTITDTTIEPNTHTVIDDTIVTP